MELYANWFEEKRSAYLYAIMAETEKNIIRKKLFTDLNIAAEKQASLWEEKIRRMDNKISLPIPFTPDRRTKIIAWLIRYMGAENIRAMLSAMKIRGMSIFSHYHDEHKHTSQSSASNLRAAVFGINDGLVSNMSLIMGIAGGTHINQHLIILAGIAGLLAGACPMGVGEYISVCSQREVYEYQIAIEKQELEEYPEEEMEELSLIYQARGVPLTEANKLAKLMIDNPKTGLNTLAREELGLNPDDLVSPIGAMLSSFFSFALGAFIPLLPFLFGNHTGNIITSIALTAMTLFFIGTIVSLFTNRSPLWHGLRMLTLGMLAGGITFFVSKLLGVSLY